VRVDWQGHKLGYVPRADNEALARFMDRGSKAEARITRLRKAATPGSEWNSSLSGFMTSAYNA